MASPNKRYVKVGRGSILFDRYDENGASTGFRHLGNCDTLTIGIESETLTMKDYTQQTAADYAETLIGTESNLTISGFEFDFFQLSLALLGNASKLTQAAATVTAETLVAAGITDIAGKYFRTSRRSISGLSLVQGTATLGTADFEVLKAMSGIVRIKPEAAVSEGTAIAASYTAGALSGTAALNLVKGAVVSKIEGQLLFVPNNATGPDDELTVFRASLTPEGELGLISDEYSKWTLKGKALSDAAGEYGGSADNPYFQTVTIAP